MKRRDTLKTLGAIPDTVGAAGSDLQHDAMMAIKPAEEGVVL